MFSKKRAVVVSVVVVVLVALFVRWQLSPVQPKSDQAVRFAVQPGWGATRIASELKNAGLIRSPWLFSAYVELLGAGSNLQAGIYELSPSMSTGQVVHLIAAGEAISSDISVTIPEGMNVWEIAAILKESGLLKDTAVAAAFARAYLGEEGRLYPETYRFAPDASAQTIVARMTDTFAEHDGFTSDQLIVASILEKEAKEKDDMALVSGIIARRRTLGMPLQIDATVAYGACRRIFQIQSSNALCDVAKIGVANEIPKDGPYNTYARIGLPAGPISNPGENALWAAANPKSSDYLYYLSTRDGSKIIYAKTLAEHLKNRTKYLGL